MTGTGERLTPNFHIDFIAAGLGAPHQMRFGAYALYGKRAPDVLEAPVAESD